MSVKNEQEQIEDLSPVSDNDILAAAAEFIKTEELKKAKEAEEKEKLSKSEADLKGSEGSQDLAGSGTQGPVEIQNLYNNGSEGTNMQPEKGVQSMRGGDPKARPGPEGKAPDANTQTGDNQTEGNEDENRPLKKEGGQQPKEVSAEGKAPDANTQTGDAQDQANKKENRPLKKMGSAINTSTSFTKSQEGNIFKKDTQVDDTQGNESKSKTKTEVLDSDMDASDSSGTLGNTQGALKDEGMQSQTRDNDGSAQYQANALENRPLEKMGREIHKSIDALATQVTDLSVRLKKFENQEDELNKSVTPATIEILAKSYNKKIREIEKEKEQLEKSTKEEINDLKKSLDDVRDSIGKPARRRETVSNFDVIEKGNSETGGQKPFYKSKTDVLERLEELRGEGKVSGDEVIAYNASNVLSTNARKKLEAK